MILQHNTYHLFECQNDNDLNRKLELEHLEKDIYSRLEYRPVFYS